MEESIPKLNLDEIRADIRLRGDQLLAVQRKLLEIGQRLDAAEHEVNTLETGALGRRRRRGRPRRAGSAPKGPTVVDMAVQVLKERGDPLACPDLARAILARGIDSGNNERSLRMSASKGKRLRYTDEDVIWIAD